MNFSEIFIRRPIATSLLMFGIALFGVVSYRALPVADLPSVDYPTLSVSASWLFRKVPPLPCQNRTIPSM